MSSESPSGPCAISVRDLGKVYQIYDRPEDRLKQALWRGRKRFHREFWALRHISIDVECGETLGIIGRNGSGKSTLLQIICSTLAPSEGCVEVVGRISAMLELGAGFNPEFTGEENVRLAASLLGMSQSAIDAVYGEIVAFADIGSFINQPVKMYSSGMYVRLAFAVAVSVKPEILVVDEALAVGDVFFQQKCIRHMQEELAGATKLLVTHDLHAITTLADRVLVLDRGAGVFLGSAREAIEVYTKSVHDEAFGAGSQNEDLVRAELQAVDGRSIPWVSVDTESCGGAGEVNIEQVAVTNDRGEMIGAVQAGDELTVYMTVTACKAKHDIIIGYIINDRLGNAICGENSCSLSDGLIELSGAGAYVARVVFEWPEIQPGEYTITLGVGEGRDPLVHRIQCWAHNVVAVSAISPNKVIHCLFNNPIKQLDIARCE